MTAMASGFGIGANQGLWSNEQALCHEANEGQQGFAWHYKAYEREQPANDRKVYADSENEARAARRGLWADAEPVPPWEFRRKAK